MKTCTGASTGGSASGNWLGTSVRPYGVFISRMPCFSQHRQDVLANLNLANLRVYIGPPLSTQQLQEASNLVWLEMTARDCESFRDCYDSSPSTWTVPKTVRTLKLDKASDAAHIALQRHSPRLEVFCWVQGLPLCVCPAVHLQKPWQTEKIDMPCLTTYWRLQQAPRGCLA